LHEAAGAGFDGVIVPDCPVEEAGQLREQARAANLTFTLLVAPTTPAERAARIAQACRGFVYLLARAGITGERQEAPDIAGRVQALRQASDTPIACGFGISTAAHVRAVTEHADAAIVGSALVRRLSDASGDPARIAGSFTRDLAAGLHAEPTQKA
jgi:tryptophan synthase alpha chain